MGRYPANRVISLLQMYDALPQNPQLVDALVLPTIRAELEGYCSTCMSRDMWYLHAFREQLVSQWHERMAQRQLYLPQNLEVKLPQKWGDPMVISWHLLLDPRDQRRVTVNGHLTPSAADNLITAHQSRLASILEATKAFPYNKLMRAS